MVFGVFSKSLNLSLVHPFPSGTLDRMKYALIILFIAMLLWNTLSQPPELTRVQVIRDYSGHYEAVPPEEFAEWWGDVE